MHDYETHNPIQIIFEIKLLEAKNVHNKFSYFIHLLNNKLYPIFYFFYFPSFIFDKAFIFVTY